MTKLGSIQMAVYEDVKKGENINLSRLFSGFERVKEFKIAGDISTKTKLKVVIPKAFTLEAKANIAKKKGEKVSLNTLLSFEDRVKELNTSDTIKKGDKITVIVET